jgi:hypothetical protein
MFDAIWSALWPTANASKEELMRWRTIMSIALMACLIAIAYAPFHYAKAQDVKQVAAGQIESQIWEAQKERCLTPIGTRLREILADRVNKLLIQYLETTGQAYNLPACSEFGGTG